VSWSSSWTTRQLTDDPNGYAIRPVAPRSRRAGPNQAIFVRGDNRTIGYRDYQTRIHKLEF
jgi:hypothetical protein